LIDVYEAACIGAAVGAQGTADVFAAKIETAFLRGDRCPSREALESMRGDVVHLVPLAICKACLPDLYTRALPMDINAGLIHE
jgi:hypothetical protein